MALTLGKPRLRLFYASDIHGSELVFRKFLNAAKFYGVDALIFGGDLTGKAIIPFVEISPGHFVADVYGNERRVEGGTALDELEQFVRDRGSYPYRTTPDEMAAMKADGELVHRIFGQVMRETAEKWVTMADDRLRGTMPCIMMPGNDDEPEVKEVLAQGDWIQDGEDKVVDLEGYQVASFGWATTTPWHSPREVTEELMLDRLTELTRGLETGRPVILNFHNPPAASGLDMAYKMSKDLKVDMAGGQAMLAPVGSTSVRRIIEQVSPTLSLHGHIHESRATTKIGRTVALNPGSAYTEGVLQGAIITLKGDKVAGQQLVNG